MRSAAFWAVFAVAAVAQWLVPLAHMRTHARVLADGEVFQVPCAAPDPLDPLRGRYLAVRPSQVEAPLARGEPEPKRGVFVCAVLERDAEGRAKVARLAARPPEKGASWVRVRVRHMQGDHVVFEWPFSRYYVNERQAPAADRWQADGRSATGGVVALVRVLDGRAVPVDLEAGGRSLRAFLTDGAAVD